MSIAPVLAETLPTRNRTPKRESEKPMAASKVLHTIEQHILVDGFKIVVDLDKSRGSYLQNSVDNRRLIDFYGFFGSTPVGFNHPHFDDPQVKRDLLRAAKVKIANSDIYSAGYAEFVATFERVVGLPPLERYLFIEGGALAVENCLKAAMDWKVRKNMGAFVPNRAQLGPACGQICKAQAPDKIALQTVATVRHRVSFHKARPLLIPLIGG